MSHNIKAFSYIDYIKKSAFTIMLFLFSINSIQGQEIKLDKILLVISSTDNKPVPYAHFYIHSQSKYLLFISDSYGRLAIHTDVDHQIDTVSVSCIGYEIKKAILSNIRDTVYLKPTVYEIGEVIVSPKKLKKISIGNKALTTIMSTSISFGKQRALHIPLEDLEGEIQSVRYFMHSFFKRSKDFAHWPFRVRLYKEDSNRGVGEDLLKEELIVMLPRGEGKWLEVDLTPFHLSLPEKGIFVAIEVLPSEFYIKNGYVKSELLDGGWINSLSIGITNFKHTKLDIQTWDYNPDFGGWNQKYCKDHYLLIQLVAITNK